jgi:hypothetical protein
MRRNFPRADQAIEMRRRAAMVVRASFLTFTILAVATPYAVSPASAGGHCVSWQFHTQKPATCRAWSGSVSGGPTQARYPGGSTAKKPCGFGQKC